MSVSLSVCISVHNTENFLRRALNSVINQTLDSIEIVLVDNGSTDSSFSIMLEYESQYPEKIRVFSQKDKGLAQGRQAGVNYSLGEFVTFLDADDYVYPDTYRKMYKNALKHNVDIVECQTVRDGCIIKSNYSGVQNSHKVLIDYFESGDMPTMLWMRIYRKSLFAKPVFPNIYVNNEDVFAFPCLLYSAKSVFYLQEPLHFYSTDNESSVMNSIVINPKSDEKLFQNRITTLYVINHVQNYIADESSLGSKFQNAFKLYCARTMLIFCLTKLRSLSVEQKIEIVCQTIKVDRKNIDVYYQDFIYHNKLIQNAITLFGLKNTLVIHNLLSRVISIFRKIFKR